MGALRHRGLAASLLRASVANVDAPFKLTVALTWRCNHRCGSCGIWSRSKGVELDAAQWDRVFGSAPQVTWLDLTGGEIVLRQDLPDIARSVLERLDRLAMVHFPTNGWLPEAAVEAARLFVRPGGPKVVVTVSFDGPEDVHDELRGLEGAFARAIDAYERLRGEPGVDVYAGMTLQPGNVDLVDRTVEAIDARVGGFDHSGLHINVAHRSSHYFANEGMAICGADALRRAVDGFRARRGPPTEPVGMVEWAYLRILDEHLDTGRSPISCRSGEISAHIAPDGTVYACTIDPRPAGRLSDHGFDLRELWSTAERRALRERIARGDCPGCWTACEANQTLLSSPARLLGALARAHRRPRRLAGARVKRLAKGEVEGLV